jgi:hypothetical protein
MRSLVQNADGMEVLPVQSRFTDATWKHINTAAYQTSVFICRSESPDLSRPPVSACQTVITSAPAFGSSVPRFQEARAQGNNSDSRVIAHHRDGTCVTRRQASVRSSRAAIVMEAAGVASRSRMCRSCRAGKALMIRSSQVAVKRHPCGLQAICLDPLRHLCQGQLSWT